MLGFGTRLQFLFFAVLVPLLAGEMIKWIVGRGRPFVGGKANAFNFAPFAGTEAYASFPSAHAVTGLRAGLRGRRGLAAGAGRDDRLCAPDRAPAAWCCWPIIRATWLPAR